jgi:prepilin-type N-terminal cleavage/methylation domain-containing protein
MRDLKVAMRRDEGLSLTELLVVMMLLGFVLAVMYAGVQGIFKGFEVAERQTQFTEEITSPMQVMDKLFSQNRTLSVVSGQDPAYVIAVNSPATGGVFKRDIFAAETSGTLTQTTYSVVTATGAETQTNRVTWAYHNANRALGRAAFVYHSGATSASVSATSANNVTITLYTTHKGRYFSGTRVVFFRNR